MHFVSYEDLGHDVRQSGGLLKVDMECLRELAGAGKLGVHVREAIKAALAEQGLGSLPDDLPRYQHDEVRVYDRRSRVGRVIQAVLTPSEAGDQALVELNFEGATAQPPGMLAVSPEAQNEIVDAMRRIEAALFGRTPDDW